MNTTRNWCSSDASGAVREFLHRYVVVIPESAPPRELLDAIRDLFKTGDQRRSVPHAFPPWTVVCQRATGRAQTLRGESRVISPLSFSLTFNRNLEPFATCPGSRTVLPKPRGGGRAGDDGARKKKRNRLRIRLAVYRFETFVEKQSGGLVD